MIDLSEEKTRTNVYNLLNILGISDVIFFNKNRREMSNSSKTFQLFLY